MDSDLHGLGAKYPITDILNLSLPHTLCQDLILIGLRRNPRLLITFYHMGSHSTIRVSEQTNLNTHTHTLLPIEGLGLEPILFLCANDPPWKRSEFFPCWLYLKEIMIRIRKVIRNNFKKVWLFAFFVLGNYFVYILYEKTQRKYFSFKVHIWVIKGWWTNSSCIFERGY